MTDRSVPTATATVASVYLSCAHCGAALTDPRHESFLFGPDPGVRPGEALTCGACGRPSLAPAVLGELG
jgi:hypothetical protein